MAAKVPFATVFVDSLVESMTRYSGIDPARADVERLAEERG
jgi:hypothetical protein